MLLPIYYYVPILYTYKCIVKIHKDKILLNNSVNSYSVKLCDSINYVTYGKLLTYI